MTCVSGISQKPCIFNLPVCNIKDFPNVHSLRGLQEEKGERVAYDLLIVTDGGCDGKAQEMGGPILPSVRHTGEYKAHIPGPPHIIRLPPHLILPSLRHTPAFPCQGENSLARDSLRLDHYPHYLCLYHCTLVFTSLHSFAIKCTISDTLPAIHSTFTLYHF